MTVTETATWPSSEVTTLTVSPTLTSPLPIAVPPLEKVVAEFNDTVRLPIIRLVSDLAATLPLRFWVAWLSGAALLRGGVDEAAELDDALERLHRHIEGLDGVVVDEGGLHLGGDGAVIDVFTGAFLGGSRRTPGREGDQADAADAERGQNAGLKGAFERVHTPLSIVKTRAVRRARHFFAPPRRAAQPCQSAPLE